MTTNKQELINLRRQQAAHWYKIYKSAHEAGLIAQRQLEDLNALPDNKKLFLTRRERRKK